jgi:hypothetical protein
VFGDAKIGSNLTVIGNLVVEGSTTTVGTDTLTVKDPLIVLANNNTSTDAVDIGFYGKYTPSGTTLYSGLFREALTGKYRLFKGLEVEPTTTVNTSGTGYTKADLVIGALEATTGTFSGNVDIDGTLDVDDVINIEGSAFGRIEIGGASGGYIDLKAPSSDDYDFRIITSSGGNEITTATGDLIFNTAETLALTIDTSQNATFEGQVTIPEIPIADTHAASKGYVDAAVEGQDTLAEILANENTTGGTDIAVSAGDDITFTDTSKSIYGTDGELEIHHNGTNSYITEDGTGALYLQGTYMYLTKSDGSQNYIELDLDGATDSRVKLNYGGATKLTTTSTGVSITGVISGLTDPSAAQDAATKNYVDTQVGANNELSEVLANGNTTGGTDIAITAGDKITNFTSTGIDDNSTSTVLTIDNTNRALFSGDVSIQANLIGNTNATGDLTILGSLYVGTYGLNDDPDLLYAENSIVRIGYYSNAKVFEVNETDFKVTATHKVGIGTSDPQTLFEVSNENSGLTPIIRLNNVDSSLNDGQNLGSIEFYNDYTNLTTANIGMFHSTDGTIAKEMRFNFGSPYGDLFKININEINAIKRFTITGSGSTPRVTLANNAGEGALVYSLRSLDSGYFGIFQGNTNVLRISPNRNVGINADPDSYSKNELVITAPDDGGVTIASATDEAAYLDFSDGSGLKNFIRVDHDGDVFGYNSWGSHLFTLGEGVDSLTLDNNGATFAQGATFAGNVTVGGTAVDAAGTGSIKSNGIIRTVLASGTVDSTLINAISGVSNGFQLSNDASNNQEYIFHNGGVQSLKIDSSGNVGIGTSTLNTISGTNPTLTLGGTGISGGLILQRAGTDKARLYENAGLMVHQGMTGVGHSFYVDASTDAMTIDTSGNVGIGTDSPQTLLNINSLSGTTYPTLGTASGVIALSINELHGMYLGVDGASGNGWIQAMREDASATAYNLILQPSGGNVGIGTDDPVGTLSVRNTTAGENVLRAEGVAGSLFIDHAGAGNNLYDAANHKFRSFAGVERMRIDSSGNLLLGNGVGNPYLAFLSAGGNGGNERARIFGYADGGTYGGGLEIQTRDSANIFQNRMTIDSSGNVGIGVAPATGVRLNIAGGVIRNIDTYNNTTANASNLVVTSGGTFERSTSSLKYKTDVRDYDKGLNEVMQLQPKYYKGINDGDTQFAGLIAEDVHDLDLTEFVQYAEDGTPDALSYSNMIALLTKSIQELKAEVDKLKQECKCKN